MGNLAKMNPNAVRSTPAAIAVPRCPGAAQEVIAQFRVRPMRKAAMIFSVMRVLSFIKTLGWFFAF